MTEKKRDRAQVEARLNALVREISADLAGLEDGQSKELLSDFVSELYLAQADRRRRDERRRKQAEGIAAAKAKGVRFGPSPKPLPGNFERCYTAWRDGELSLTEAVVAHAAQI